MRFLTGWVARPRLGQKPWPYFRSSSTPCSRPLAISYWTSISLLSPASAFSSIPFKSVYCSTCATVVRPPNDSVSMWSSSTTARPFLGLAKVTRAAHRASARRVNDARRCKDSVRVQIVNVSDKRYRNTRRNGSKGKGTRSTTRSNDVIRRSNVGPSIAASPPITHNTHRAARSLPLTNKHIQSALFVFKTGALRIFRIISISISREQFLQHRRNFLGELQCPCVASTTILSIALREQLF